MSFTIPIPIERGQLVALPLDFRVAIVDPNAYWRRPFYWATLGEDFSALNAILLGLVEVDPAPAEIELIEPPIEIEPAPADVEPGSPWFGWLWRRWR